jgi:hypothetical protein
MSHIKICIHLGLILSACWVMTALPAIANDKAKAQGVVDKMTESFNHLSADPNMGWFRSNLKHARGYGGARVIQRFSR